MHQLHIHMNASRAQPHFQTVSNALAILRVQNAYLFTPFQAHPYAILAQHIFQTVLIVVTVSLVPFARLGMPSTIKINAPLAIL